VKLLDEAAAADPAQVVRFEANARKLAAVEHKNIVAVLALGRHEGAPFVAMQKAEGRSLAEHVHARGGRLPGVEAARVVAQLAEAELRAAVLKAASEHPNDRFASPLELQQALLPCAAEKAVAMVMVPAARPSRPRAAAHAEAITAPLAPMTAPSSAIEERTTK